MFRGNLRRNNNRRGKIHGISSSSNTAVRTCSP
jgi:hypothetical protein